MWSVLHPSIPVFAHLRRPLPDSRAARALLVVLNMTAQDGARFEVPAGKAFELMASTRLSLRANGGVVKVAESGGQDIWLQAYEGMAIAVTE